jgi:hypothetical protein
MRYQEIVREQAEHAKGVRARNMAAARKPAEERRQFVQRQQQPLYQTDPFEYFRQYQASGKTADYYQREFGGGGGGGGGEMAAVARDLKAATRNIGGRTPPALPAAPHVQRN